MFVSRLFVLLPVILVSAQLTSGQQSKVVTITEPGSYTLENLFTNANVVALVRIVSGDAENYDRTVYKGEVLQSFKGTSQGGTVYFGPFVGERLGSEYVLFLRKVTKPVSPRGRPTASYGTIHYWEIFDEGYSSMETSYECVFDGKEITQKCDYGVRVCTDYIKLPGSLPAFPPETNDPPFGCRWVRKALFVSMLDTLTHTNK